MVAPEKQELKSLLADKWTTWEDVTGFIEDNYEMDKLWSQDKSGEYELKYRRSGRTLCGLYPKAGTLEILIIFGKAERDKFEGQRADFTAYINDLYDQTKQYHDGRWMYIPLEASIVDDIKGLIRIKKRPNKKKALI
ncbi:DUF3788 domain-containing protein [Alkaliphilus crotonatoxidans]